MGSLWVMGGNGPLTRTQDWQLSTTLHCTSNTMPSLPLPLPDPFPLLRFNRRPIRLHIHVLCGIALHYSFETRVFRVQPPVIAFVRGRRAVRPSASASSATPCSATLLSPTRPMMNLLLYPRSFALFRGRRAARRSASATSATPSSATSFSTTPPGEGPLHPPPKRRRRR